MYKSMEECVLDLEKHGHLIRIKHEVDPDLEMAEIHRRFFEAGGPAILFEKVKGSPFRAVSNIYGTFERTDFVFRKTFDKVQKVIELKADPTNFLKNPLRYIGAPFTALSALPMKNWGKAPVAYQETTIDQLPLVKSWPMDGGAFVTLPQVFTLPPNEQNVMKSNIGMYRIQLSGNDYNLNKEVGLHYQLHRGIGVHHTEYNKSDEPFRCCVFIGGPPSHAFAAIMPLPEGLSEVTFAGLLGGRRFRYVRKDGFTISADADFVITGIVRKGEKMPEGPFGDHLGYYSLQHDFPVMDVEKVYARKDAIWQFTAVGRPPAEDSSFGYMIHKLVSPLLTQEFPGVKEINAVDAAGVHPLLLAIGSERYMPFRERKPEEILIQANRILGSGQTSLAKFLFIAATGDDPNLSAEDIPHYFNHLLERVDWTRDLHFQTKTTIDTLDYSGDGWNAGSKVIVAACGDKVRSLTSTLPDSFDLPTGFKNPVFVQNGILAIEGEAFTGRESYADTEKLCQHLEQYNLDSIPLVLLVDDSTFVAETTNNYVWVTYTRANPSHDIHGVKPFIEHKHWGCQSALVIDARIKPHHAPPLVKDPKITAKVDALFAEGGLLHGTI